MCISMARSVIVVVLLVSLAAATGGEAVTSKKKKVKAVYVFGDSYADTGNHDPVSEEASIYKPWREPYGYSWPGKPFGRYSNGYVFTDFFASYMGLKKPIPFRMLNISTTNNEQEREKYEGFAKARVKTKSRGINFAFGGSGVFTTLNTFVPNVTTQIQQFSTTIDLGIVTMKGLSKSLALFVINGNDYIAYYELYQTFTGIESFIPQVVEQMAYDLESLSELGFTNFVITNVGPVGCLPYLTYLINYTSCLETFNNLSALHNSLLESQISNLQEKLPNSTFLTLDFNKAFSEVIQEGSLSIRPCCEGILGESCGAVNESGDPLYTVCSDVEASLYWDAIHPTNYGWFTLLKILLPTFHYRYDQPLAYAKI